MSRTMPLPINTRSRRRHRLLGAFSGLLAFVSLLSVLARALPQELQALPYVPVIVSFTPWFILLSALSLLFALVSRRWGVALIMTLCLCLQCWWQYPFFAGYHASAGTRASSSRSSDDAANIPVRVMTFNVYKGQADPSAIVEIVKQEHIQVLTMQETTTGFVEALNRAGIGHYLPYAQISSSDGVYGNGLWSATPLGDPVDDEVGSSASFMPSGTVKLSGGRSLRFVSVHTTSPKPGVWGQWRNSLDELSRMRSRTDARYVFMGDFNATTDHTVFRDFLGSRFTDAAQDAGRGFTFSWPANRGAIPAFAGIDHIVLDGGMGAGQVHTVHLPRSDHRALLATITVR